MNFELDGLLFLSVLKFVLFVKFKFFWLVKRSAHGPFLIKGLQLLLWNNYLCSILSEDLYLVVAFFKSYYQLIFELVLDHSTNFTFTALCTSTQLRNKGEVCCVCYFIDCLLHHIIDNHTSWRLRLHFAWELLDVLRVTKPKKGDLSVAYRCY